MKDGTQAAVSEIVRWMVYRKIDDYMGGYSTTPNKYNVDAIFCALGAGLERYMRMSDGEKLRVETSYQNVGEAFPLHYPIE